MKNFLPRVSTKVVIDHGAWFQSLEGKKGITMPKDWEDITDEEILNFEGSQTAIMARYERIMNKKTIDALIDVRMGLHDVKKSMHTETDKLVNVQKQIDTSQSKLQRVAIALTVVIALSTVVYTWITWQSVQAQREANNIQREALSAQLSANNKLPSNKALKSGAPKSSAP